MTRIKVGAGVLNQTPLDWDGNRDRIVEAIRAAKHQSVAMLCLPELCITGYGCEDAFNSIATLETSLEILEEILPETANIVVSLGLPLFHHGGLYNTACLIANQQIQGFVAKQNLAGEGLHYEPRWFKPWPPLVKSTTEIHGTDYPIGDLVFNCGGVHVGFEICEDAWVANRPAGRLANEGAEILFNPSASHFAFGKHHVRQRFVSDGSRAFHVGYVYANLLGNEAGRAIYDGDAMIASCGQMLASGPRFSYRDFSITSAIIDVNDIRNSRLQAHQRQASEETDQRRVTVEVRFPKPKPDVDSTNHDRVTWESSPYLKEEEFSRAVALGLFDYMRKSRSHGFVVSLSGGADSSAVATLCALMVKFAEDELGRDGLLEKLSYLHQLTDLKPSDSLVPALLTCVYQSTKNSSQTTYEAAQSVAESLPATFITVSVDALVDKYIANTEQVIGRPLSWENDDLTLQNIQARARGPGVWMLANIHNALLLATSNRSEAAVGYATMDGDTCGGLSPIAGIDKAFLRQWLTWMEKVGPTGCGSLASLAKVNCQAPTAELRPPHAGQTDEHDLMPYDLLDAIERAAIRDKKSPVDVFQVMCGNFPQYDAKSIGEWIQRFFRLWSRNQWKRERYAPSFHVDDENLDPKTWCRFPILSGGYRRELRELDKLLQQLDTSS